MPCPAAPPSPPAVTPQHNPEQISPNINSLVKDGIMLEGHYTFQYCSPTRSSFLSGRLPIHVNMEQPSSGSSPGGIDLRMTLISQILKTANYSTHFIGKGHIGAYAHANLPINRGFDVSTPVTSASPLTLYRFTLAPWLW